MKRFNVIQLLKMFLASIGWKLFIWGNGTTQEKYWEEVYQQEQKHKDWQIDLNQYRRLKNRVDEEGPESLSLLECKMFRALSKKFEDA